MLYSTTVAAGDASPDDVAQRQSAPARRAPPPTTEDAGRVQARAHAVAAFTALDSGSYPEAVTQFSEALTLVDVPTLRVGRAEALFQLGKWLEAKADYEAALGYVLQPGDSASFVESKTSAKTKLESLSSRIPRLRVQTTAAYAEVVVDDLPAVRLPNGQELPLNPGAHRVVVSAAKSSVTHAIEARDAQVVTVEGPELSLETTTRPAVPDEAPPLPTATDHTREPSGIGTELVVSASVTGVLAVGAVVTGVLFLDARSEYTDARNDPSTSDTRVRALYDRTKTWGWVNTGLIAGAVAAAGVTTYFWLAPQFAGAPSRAQSTPGPASLTPTGVWLGTAGHF